MPDENENNIAISELDEALDLTDSAQFPYTQNNGGTLTTFKARLTQIAAKIIEGLSFAGINLPTSAGDKTVENSINFLLDSVGGDPNGNISDSYDPTATYNTGDVCIYNNVLYICNEDNITGTFDPSKWSATTIDNIIGSLSTLATTDKSSLVGAVNEVDAYKAGDTVTFNFQQLFCRIDASGKRISVFIPLNKRIPSTLTVTASGNYSVYFYDGSSLLSNHDIANDTQSIQNTPIGIVLTITLTTALSQTLGYGGVELRNTFTLTFS